MTRPKPTLPWTPLEPKKMVPLHQEIGAGEHPVYGRFRILLSVTGGLWVGVAPPGDPDGDMQYRYITAAALLDSFFLDLARGALPWRETEPDE